MSEAYHGGKLRCYVHIMDQGLCYRVNTLAAYIDANRLVGQTFTCCFEALCKTYISRSLIPVFTLCLQEIWFMLIKTCNFFTNLREKLIIDQLSDYVQIQQEFYGSSLLYIMFFIIILDHMRLLSLFGTCKSEIRQKFWGAFLLRFFFYSCFLMYLKSSLFLISLIFLYIFYSTRPQSCSRNQQSIQRPSFLRDVR